jgi:hypothetical protein
MLGDLRYVSAGEYAAFAGADSETLRRETSEAAPPELRERILQSPLGTLEMIDAFGPNGGYGKYLRTLNAVVRIDGILFVHGGISPALSSRRCGDINAAIRREFEPGTIDKTMAASTVSLSVREDGPLWYRGLLEPDAVEQDIDAMLHAQEARAIVVAHTPAKDGRVVRRFGGKVTGIDTGMLPGYVPEGRASVLEISGRTVTAIYTDRRDVLQQ